MSGLWTPYGEHRPEDEAAEPVAGPGPGIGVPGLEGPGDLPTPEEEAAAREQLRQIREQLANTPVADIIANHVIGLWELAVLHLTPGSPSQAPAPASAVGQAAAYATPDDGGGGPNLDEARLAIDAIAAIVEGLGDRLGQNADPLRDALAQLRLAFVEASQPRSGTA